MTSLETRSTLRADGCGARLRDAREAAGFSLEQVGARLKMPVRVLQALEDENWDHLGAAVFVRGQLRSYARLLGVNIDSMLETGAGSVESSRLVSHVHTPPLQRLIEQVGRRLVYVVMTAVIVVPVWMMATRGPVSLPPPQDTTPLDMPSAESTLAPPLAVPAQRATVAASMAPMPSRPSSAAALSIRFNGDSWVEAVGTDGTMMEKGMAARGTQRSYANGQVATIVLGNASVVEVRRAGQPVSLAPFQSANVVRFGVSSDGSLVPLAD